MLIWDPISHTSQDKALGCTNRQTLWFTTSGELALCVMRTYCKCIQKTQVKCALQWPVYAKKIPITPTSTSTSAECASALFWGCCAGLVRTCFLSGGRGIFTFASRVEGRSLSCACSLGLTSSETLFFSKSCGKCLYWVSNFIPGLSTHVEFTDGLKSHVTHYAFVVYATKGSQASLPTLEQNSSAHNLYEAFNSFSLHFLHFFQNSNNTKLGKNIVHRKISVPLTILCFIQTGSSSCNVLPFPQKAWRWPPRASRGIISPDWREPWPNPEHARGKQLHASKWLRWISHNGEFNERKTVFSCALPTPSSQCRRGLLKTNEKIKKLQYRQCSFF